MFRQCSSLFSGPANSLTSNYRVCDVRGLSHASIVFVVSVVGHSERRVPLIELPGLALLGEKPECMDMS